MKNRKTAAFAAGLLIVIAALLALILAILPEQGDVDIATEGDDYQAGGGREDPPIDSPTEEIPDPEATGSEPKPEKYIYIVIDDVGNNIAHLERFLDTPVPLTFALMPGRPFTEQSALSLSRAGFDMILHQPMEPMGGQDPGVGAILTGMSPDRIHEILESNLSEIPGVLGLNNHMGSKATADTATMKAVMSYLDKTDLFFLDSVTTDQSVAAAAAEEESVPFARRTALFLDNEGEKSLVEKALASGLKVAERDGMAVMIGHLKTGVLISILEERHKDLMGEGFVFRGMAEYFTGRSK